MFNKGCPDVLCDDCKEYCEMKKIMKLVSEGLDPDKIAEEIEQDIKEQSQEVTISSVWEKRDEVPYELKVSKEIETKPIVFRPKKSVQMKYTRGLCYFLCFLAGMMVGLIYATCSLHFIHHLF